MDALTLTPGEDIWTRRLTIQRERRDFAREATAKYDWDVYSPAMSALRNECFHATGHRPTGFYTDGRGHRWQHCTYCSARIDLPSE